MHQCKMFDPNEGGAKYLPFFENNLLIQPLDYSGEQKNRKLLFCQCGHCFQYFVSEWKDTYDQFGKDLHVESYIAVTNVEEAQQLARENPSVLKLIRGLKRPGFFSLNHRHLGINRFNETTQTYEYVTESVKREDYEAIQSLDIFTIAQRDGISVLNSYNAMWLMVFHEDGSLRRASIENITSTEVVYGLLHILDVLTEGRLLEELNRETEEEFLDYITQFAQSLKYRSLSDRFTIYRKDVPLHDRIAMKL